MRNLAGNMVMLFPLGLLLAAATRWRPAWVVVTIVGTSAGIELWQLVVDIGRSPDIDDVILNSTGGLLGFLVGLIGLRVLEMVAPFRPSTLGRNSASSRAAPGGRWGRGGWRRG